VVAAALACNARDKEPVAGAPDQGGDEDRGGARAASGSAGGAAAATCTTPSGRYQSAFEARGGDCGSFALDELMPLDNSVSIAKHIDRDVETESFVDNCSLTLRQTVLDRSTGHVRLLMKGDALELNAGGTVATGRVSLQRFDQIGALACSGEYDATLTKADNTAGAATSP
jgi:hypothetical protein